MQLAWACGAFLALGFLVAVDLDKDADTAFIMAVLVVLNGYLGWHVHARMAAIFGPLTAILVVHTALWLAVLLSLPPALLRIAPVMIALLAFGGLVAASAYFRRWFVAEHARHGAVLWQRYSELIVVGAFAAVFAPMTALRFGVPLHVIAGYAALTGIPLSCGWRLSAVADAASHATPST